MLICNLSKNILKIKEILKYKAGEVENNEEGTWRLPGQHVRYDYDWPQGRVAPELMGFFFLEGFQN